MSLIFPKKEILYAPMLGTLGGGSARGFGQRGKSGPLFTPFNVRVNATSGANITEGGSLAQYRAAATRGGDTIIDRYGSGILQFYVSAGTYSGSARSASGSGQQHAQYREVSSFTLTLSQDTPIMVLVPNHGEGNYSAGGGFFMVMGEDPATVQVQDVLMVIGGGGGGYSQWSSNALPGPMETTTSAASTRRQTGTPMYDDGAGLFNTYTPLVHNEYSNGQSSPYDSLRPQHFVQGGRGGRATDCGQTFGGFGGGGGSCPAGGGGYVGGKAGSNNPQQYGGGGGTSYYNNAYISNVTSTTPGSNTTTRSGLNQNHAGYLDIS